MKKEKLDLKDPKNWPPITCQHCQQSFPGALYEDQPQDCCYDCYDKKIGKYPQLWQRLRQLVDRKHALQMLEAIVCLSEENLLHIKE